MPLFKGKSKAAFSKNVETEMHEGKPQDQALAIAYSIKRKKKKMAQGGEADSATEVIPDKGWGKIIRTGMAEGGRVADQKRPMPDNRYNDSMEISKNSGNKAPVNDQWTDNPTIKQSQKPSLTKLSRPKFVGSDAFSVRDRDDVEKDLDRMSSEAPDGYKNQPRARYNEEGADRQGPEVSDMQAEHSTKKAPYKKEIEDQYSQDEAESDMKQSYAKGGEVEASDYSHPENKYEHDFASDTPSEDEGASYARSRNEEGPDRQGPPISDNEASHALSGRQYRDSMRNEDDQMELNPAEGHYRESGGMKQPDEEEADYDRESSIAAAIMAKKEREASLMSDSDIDEMVRMYEGGEITRKSGSYNGEDSIYSDDSDQADIARNAEEDANMEDQASFDAMRKENYSESEGLKQLDSPMDSAQKSDSEEMDSHDRHDKVEMIRRKMMSKRQFKRD